MIAEKLSWEEFGEQARGKTAILVFGAIEPHGKHLQLDVDIAVPVEIARRVEAKVPEEAVLFPPVNYGYLYSLRKFPGAVSLEFDTLKAAARDIFSSLLRDGISKFLVVIGHGGNTAPVKQALKDLSFGHEFTANVVEWWGMLEVEAGHADEVEGSMSLAAGGRVVKGPVQEERTDYVGYVVPTPDDLFTPSGYIGKVGGINKDEGEKWMEEVAEQLAELVRNGLKVRK